MIRRGYVATGERRVHFRYAGTGPALVLLHASPVSSRAFNAHIAAFATRFSVIALDTPGYGLSDPLPVSNPQISDYARALAATLDALGIKRAHVYGRHTGAAIAVQFAHDYPERSAMLYCDGLPIYEAERKRRYLASYVKPIELRWDGAHLIQSWFRFREQHVFWPWFEQGTANRADMDVPDVRMLHDGTVDLLLSGANHGLAELAVFRHPTLDRLRAVPVQTVIAAREGDSLFERLALVENLPPHIRLVRNLRETEKALAAELVELVSVGNEPFRHSPPRSFSRNIARSFVDHDAGQIAIRWSEAAAAPKWLILPGAPGSGASCEDILEDLGRDGGAVTFDYPGQGDSEAPIAAISQESWTTAAHAVLDHFGMRSAKIVAHGAAGAAIGQALAARGGNVMVRTMVEPEIADAPDISPDWDGSHLLKAWHARRDAQLWQPWNNRVRAARAAEIGDITPASLMAQTIEAVKQPANFAAAARIGIDAS